MSRCPEHPSPRGNRRLRPRCSPGGIDGGGRPGALHGGCHDTGLDQTPASGQPAREHTQPPPRDGPQRDAALLGGLPLARRPPPQPHGHWARRRDGVPRPERGGAMGVAGGRDGCAGGGADAPPPRIAAGADASSSQPTPAQDGIGLTQGFEGKHIRLAVAAPGTADDDERGIRRPDSAEERPTPWVPPTAVARQMVAFGRGFCGTTGLAGSPGCLACAQCDPGGSPRRRGRCSGVAPRDSGTESRHREGRGVRHAPARRCRQRRAAPQGLPSP